MALVTNARQNQGADELRSNHDELVARASALVPALRSRAAEADELRKAPPESVAAAKAAGLYKVLQARRHGGYQMSLRTHIDTVAEVARGCTSTAWCMAVTHAHSWLMALFPEQAQEETYGADPDALVSAVIAPRGAARWRTASRNSSSACSRTAPHATTGGPTSSA